MPVCSITAQVNQVRARVVLEGEKDRPIRDITSPSRKVSPAP